MWETAHQNMVPPLSRPLSKERLSGRHPLRRATCGRTTRILPQPRQRGACRWRLGGILTKQRKRLLGGNAGSPTDCPLPGSAWRVQRSDCAGSALSGVYFRHHRRATATAGKRRSAGPKHAPPGRTSTRPWRGTVSAPAEDETLIDLSPLTTPAASIPNPCRDGIHPSITAGQSSFGHRLERIGAG